jgi:hypothetical protein
MKNIKCLSCKFYYIRPSSQNYNFSLCTKYNTFSVIARQDNLLCGPTYKNYEIKADETKKVDENKPIAEKPIENKKYEYDNSYDSIMSQIHI